MSTPAHRAWPRVLRMTAERDTQLDVIAAIRLALRGEHELSNEMIASTANPYEATAAACGLALALLRSFAPDPELVLDEFTEGIVTED